MLLSTKNPSLWSLPSVQFRGEGGEGGGKILVLYKNIVREL